MKTREALLFSAFAVLGCEKKSPSPAPAASATGKPTSPATPIAPDSHGDGGTPVMADDPKEKAAEIAALAKARAAVAGKKYDVAIGFYDDALKHAPHDAAALGERGYVKFLDGRNDAEVDLDAARDLGATAKVAAQIWYNLGLVRESRGEGDEAKIAFATSNSILPSSAAQKKLAGLSICQAEVGASDDDADLAANFLDVAKRMDVAASDEADAKRLVCVESYTADGSGDVHDVCDGPSPWKVSHDHLMFFQHVHVIFEAAKKSDGMFVASIGQEGSWPARCTGSIAIAATSDGTFGRVTTTFEGGGSVIIEKGGDTKDAVNLVDQGDYQCADGVGSIDDAFYDLRTGKAVLHVRRAIPIRAKAPTATVTYAHGTVTLGGTSCETKIDLNHPSIPGTNDGGK